MYFLQLLALTFFCCMNDYRANETFTLVWKFHKSKKVRPSNGSCLSAWRTCLSIEVVKDSRCGVCHDLVVDNLVSLVFPNIYVIFLIIGGRTVMCVFRCGRILHFCISSESSVGINVHWLTPFILNAEKRRERFTGNPTVWSSSISTTRRKRSTNSRHLGLYKKSSSGQVELKVNPPGHR